MKAEEQGTDEEKVAMVVPEEEAVKVPEEEVNV
jgi:hypothetical protein